MLFDSPRIPIADSETRQYWLTCIKGGLAFSADDTRNGREL
jgi:hypothetical protein